jgi:multidrug resistance efflux pump
MSTTCPRLRSDLLVSRQETPGGVIFVIKDPVVGRFVRLKAPVYFLVQQFDGTTPLEEVRRRGEAHLDATLQAATLEKFAARLQGLGLLDHEAARQQDVSSPRAPARVQGNLFYLRFRAVDPDRFLGWLAPRLSFVFTRTFAGLSGATILFAATLALSNWDELHGSVSQLYRPETVLLVWLILLCIVIGHELSHGLTCKHFGGKVHEIGFLLIYLQPAMYCNVSDAWMFPRKSRRLLVTLAGAWFDLGVWAAATLFWRATEPGSAPNYFALVVATTLGIKSLFNLNPLIKLDGYYLLSDFVEIPNLRRRAFSHIGHLLRRVCMMNIGNRRSGQIEATARERRIYWLYGTLAWTYSVWLISFILIHLGGFLIGRYQGWGFAFMVALVAAIFRRPLQKTLRFLASQLLPSQSIIRVMKRLLTVLVILGCAGAALYFIQPNLKVAGEFRILPIHNADVRAEVEGIIEHIAHDEGDVVSAGELIARLSDRDLRAELGKIKAEVAEREARLKLLKAGARAEEVDLARVTVAKDGERLKHAASLMEMEKQLYGEKLSSKKDLETAADQVSLRQGELDESRATLKLLLAGSRAENIEATEAELSRLAAQQKYIEDQLQRLRVVSPIDGVITTHRLKEIRGANVKKGDLIAEVHEFRTVSAEISVSEKEIADVRIGQTVVLKARAHLNTNFHGRVVSISPVATKQTEGVPQRNFLVVTELENSALLLKPEMSGNAKIFCGQRRLYEIVFRRLIHFVRVEFWSWW